MSEQKIDGRLVDHAKRILTEADIPQEAKAVLWDHYHDSKHSRELAQRIAKFGAPDNVKQALVLAKHISDPENAPTPEFLQPTVKALTALTQIDPLILAEVEKRPALAKVLVEAALKGRSR